MEDLKIGFSSSCDKLTFFLLRRTGKHLRSMILLMLGLFLVWRGEKKHKVCQPGPLLLPWGAANGMSVGNDDEWHDSYRNLDLKLEF